MLSKIIVRPDVLRPTGMPATVEDMREDRICNTAKHLLCYCFWDLFYKRLFLVVSFPGNGLFFVNVPRARLLFCGKAPVICGLHVLLRAFWFGPL